MRRGSPAMMVAAEAGLEREERRAIRGAGLQTSTAGAGRPAPRSLRYAFAATRTGPIGLAVVALLVVSALSAPVITPHDPTAVSPLEGLQGPSARHWLGTDEVGADVLSRLLHGARSSLAVAFGAVGASMLGGLVLGLVSGYLGGSIDAILMRLVDALMAFPVLILALGIAAAIGPGLLNVMIALAIVYLPTFARLTRAETTAMRTRDFVEAVHALGASPARIVTRHILPNIAPTLIVQAAIGMSLAVLTESSLSFLGLGVQPPTPSWGTMISAGRNFLEYQPLIALAPGLAIMLAVLGFNYLGDGLREALDPTLKDR